MIEKCTISPAKCARYKAIVRSASRCFLTDGIRATTMTSIAEASDISKVTLYSYFSAKEDVFEACADAFLERLEDAFCDEILRDGPAAQRIAAALTRVHLTVFDELRWSPCFEEVMSSNESGTGTVCERLDRIMEEEMHVALVSDEWPDSDAQRLSRILLAGSLGIAKRDEAREDIEKDIAILVNRCLGGSWTSG